MDRLNILEENLQLIDFQVVDPKQQEIDIRSLLESNGQNYMIRRLTKLEIDFIDANMEFDFDMTHIVGYLGFNRKLLKVPITIDCFSGFMKSKIIGSLKNDVEQENKDTLLSIMFTNAITQNLFGHNNLDRILTEGELISGAMLMLCMGG